MKQLLTFLFLFLSISLLKAQTAKQSRPEGYQLKFPKELFQKSPSHLTGQFDSGNSATAFPGRQPTNFRSANWNQGLLQWKSDSTLFSTSIQANKKITINYSYTSQDTTDRKDFYFNAYGQDSLVYSYIKRNGNWTLTGFTSSSYDSARNKISSINIFPGNTVGAQGDTSYEFNTFDPSNRLTSQFFRIIHWFNGTASINRNGTVFHFPNSTANYDTVTFYVQDTQGQLEPAGRTVDITWLNESQMASGKTQNRFSRGWYTAQTLESHSFGNLHTSEATLYDSTGAQIGASRGTNTRFGNLLTSIYERYNAVTYSWDSTQLAYEKTDTSFASITDSVLEYAWQNGIKSPSYGYKYTFLLDQNGDVHRLLYYRFNTTYSLYFLSAKTDYFQYAPLATVPNLLVHLEMAPNPVTDKLWINLPELRVAESQGTLYNPQGQPCAQSQIVNGKASFDLLGLPPGLYEARFIDNGKVYTGRVVKE